LSIPSFSRHLAALEIKGRRFVVINDRAFVRKGQAIVPFGPVGVDYSVDKQNKADLFKNLGGAWLQTTSGFSSGQINSNDRAGWYAVICQEFVGLAEVPSANTRSQLRRALKNCEVHKTSARDVATLGYETYCAAHSRYRGWAGKLPTRAEFANRVMTDEPWADIRHQWLVYVNGEVAGFAQVLVWGDLEADYTLIKLHPKFLKYYTGYALIHRLNEYYLAEKKVSYVSDGFRSVLHETNVQEFLVNKFGFRRARCNLRIAYRPPLGAIVAACRPIRGLLGKVHPNIRGLLELDRLSRASPTVD
jgi:hypothetical protein